MSLTKAVGSLAHQAVSTAVSAARHPLSTASMAAGLVKGTAETGLHLVRGATGSRTTDPADHARVDEAENRATSEEAPEPTSESTPEPTSGPTPGPAEEVAEQPSDAPREPQVVPKPVPEIDELPEPVVIEADDAPGEPFHTEPKAASRDSAHGGPPGDREEVEGYLEEVEPVLDPAAQEPEPVWTSESEPTTR